MNAFLFFAAAYGAAVALAVLPIGGPFRAAGTWIDRKLFPNRWIVAIPEWERGGWIRKLTHCPACLAFWIALAGTFRLLPFERWSVEDGIDRVAWALASAGATWIVHVTLTKLGQYEL